MNNCPQHTDCTWYRHNADRVGTDLGVGDGITSGIDFAKCHAPMESHLYPVSNGRGDYYALGFLSGVVKEWCEKHETSDCLATWACAKNFR